MKDNRILLYSYSENYAKYCVRYNPITNFVCITQHYVNKEKIKNYNRSEKGKESMKKYRQKPEIKQRRKEYCQSENCKKSKRKYYLSEKGKQIIRKIQKRFYQTEKGKQKMRRDKAKRKRNLDFIPLFPNIFPPEVKIDYHHVDDIFTIPSPYEVHKLNYGKDHREKMNPIAFSYYNHFFMQNMYKVLFKNH